MVNIFRVSHILQLISRAFFFSVWVFFHNHSQTTGLQGKGKGIFFNSSLPLPPALQTLRHQPGDYFRQLTSAYILQLAKETLQNTELAYRNSWTLDARVGRWTLDAGLQTLDSRRWTLDSGCWTLDAECQTVDLKTLKIKTIQSFENN